MQKRNKVLAGVLTGALVLSAGPMALAATANYNDSSVTGGSAAWQDWVKEWETVAADYTKVSLTPGADETQLNFAWYSKTESGKAATPVVHFGTDKDHLTAFTGKAAQVDDSLTDGVAYDYNHVTVTGLEANTTYYYTVEKNGVQSEVQEYKTFFIAHKQTRRGCWWNSPPPLSVQWSRECASVRRPPAHSPGGPGSRQR